MSKAFTIEEKAKFYNDLASISRASDSVFTLIGDLTTGLSYIDRSIRIKNVIYNDPATVIFWTDGDKTVVKCGENDEYDPEKGLAMAIAKKFLGNKGSYYNLFTKWLPKDYKKAEDTVHEPDGCKGVYDVCSAAEQNIKTAVMSNVKMAYDILMKIVHTCRIPTIAQYRCEATKAIDLILRYRMRYTDGDTISEKIDRAYSYLKLSLKTHNRKADIALYLAKALDYLGEALE